MPNKTHRALPRYKISDFFRSLIEVDGRKPESKVGEWVKEKASKVLAGGVNVGTKIGSELLTAWIKQHYGL
jgi:hypothetical protein